MEFLSMLMDVAPIPPTEPGLVAKFFAAIFAAVGGLVWSASKLIKKTIKKHRGDKK